MVKHNIEFEKWLSINNDKSFGYIAEKIEKVEKNDIVYINLCSIYVINSDNLIILLMLVYLLSKKVMQRIYIIAEQKILSYLYSIGFYKLNYVSRKDLFFDQIIKCDNVLLPIMKFVGKYGRDDLLNMIRMNLHKYGSIIESVQHIIINLSENCLEHTSQDPERIDCFAYVEKNNSIVKIVIMDFGEGFLESFLRNRTEEDIHNSIEAVKAAFIEHKTSKKESNYGAGLWALKDIISEKKGSVVIRTGDVLAKFDENGNIATLTEVPYTEGSCILVEFHE